VDGGTHEPAPDPGSADAGDFDVDVDSGDPHDGGDVSGPEDRRLRHAVAAACAPMLRVVAPLVAGLEHCAGAAGGASGSVGGGRVGGGLAKGAGSGGAGGHGRVAKLAVARLAGMRELVAALEDAPRRPPQECDES